MYYIQLPTGGPTQGDVWSNLPSGPGSNELCDGLVITPRCDFAHSKSPVLNYLPIVNLEKYLLSVACFPHVEQILRETRDGLRSKVGALDVDGLFDIDIPIEEIRDEIKRIHSTSNLPRSRQLEKALAEFETGYEKIQELTALLHKPQLSLGQLRSTINKRRLLTIQRDLIKNNHADTYFLPPCMGLLELPSLVLLRHIYTCPIGFVDRSQNKKIGPSDLLTSIPAPERLLRLASPFIESLMAKFAALFTRVGTRDIPDPMVQAFVLSDDTGPK
jgi:hypothetical protein